MSQCFYIIDNCRLPHISVIRWVWRFIAGFASFSFHRFEQSSFFAANISSASHKNADRKIKLNFLTIIHEFVNCFLQFRFEKKIFATQVNISFFCTDYISAYSHSCKHFIGHFRENFTVFKRTGLTLIGITDNIFYFAFSICRQFPFKSGRKTCSTASFQLRTYKFIY